MRPGVILRAVAAFVALACAAQAEAGAYRNFRAAIYVTVGDTKRLADPATFERQFTRVSSQLHFDKVYIEAYRSARPLKASGGSGDELAQWRACLSRLLPSSPPGGLRPACPPPSAG